MEITYIDIAQAQSEGRRAALCIVVAVKGTAPRHPSSKMLVFEDGSSKGTVGGGNVEFEVIEAAKKIISSRSPELLTFNLKDHLGMICGGEVSVYIEPVAIPVPLYIFGAGHVGKAVAMYAADFGFAVHLIDRRPEMFAEVDKQRIKCIEGDYKDVLPTLPKEANSFYVITTPRHEYDEEVLAQVAKFPNAYVGMMASEIKVAAVRERFIKEDILSKEILDKIDMPIGIPIANETPAEIAISILAKIIDVKNRL